MPWLPFILGTLVVHIGVCGAIVDRMTGGPPVVIVHRLLVIICGPLVSLYFVLFVALIPRVAPSTLLPIVGARPQYTGLALYAIFSPADIQILGWPLSAHNLLLGPTGAWNASCCHIYLLPTSELCLVPIFWVGLVVFFLEQLVLLLLLLSRLLTSGLVLGKRILRFNAPFIGFSLPVTLLMTLNLGWLRGMILPALMRRGT